MADERIIGRVLKKPREAIQIKTRAIKQAGAPEKPVVVLEVVVLRADEWKHTARYRDLAGLTIRADLVDKVIALLQQAKAEVDGDAAPTRDDLTTTR